MTYILQRLAPGSFDLVLDGKVVGSLVRDVSEDGHEGDWMAETLDESPPYPRRLSAQSIHSRACWGPRSGSTRQCPIYDRGHAQSGGEVVHARPRTKLETPGVIFIDGNGAGPGCGCGRLERFQSHGPRTLVPPILPVAELDWRRRSRPPAGRMPLGSALLSPVHEFSIGGLYRF